MGNGQFGLNLESDTPSVENDVGQGISQDYAKVLYRATFPCATDSTTTYPADTDNSPTSSRRQLLNSSFTRARSSSVGAKPIFSTSLKNMAIDTTPCASLKFSNDDCIPRKEQKRNGYSCPVVSRNLLGQKDAMQFLSGLPRDKDLTVEDGSTPGDGFTLDDGFTHDDGCTSDNGSTSDHGFTPDDDNNNNVTKPKLECSDRNIQEENQSSKIPSNRSSTARVSDVKIINDNNSKAPSNRSSKAGVSDVKTNNSNSKIPSNKSSKARVLDMKTNNSTSKAPSNSSSKARVADVKTNNSTSKIPSSRSSKARVADVKTNNSTSKIPSNRSSTARVADGKITNNDSNLPSNQSSKARVLADEKIIINNNDSKPILVQFPKGVQTNPSLWRKSDSLKLLAVSSKTSSLPILSRDICSVSFFDKSQPPPPLVSPRCSVREPPPTVGTTDEDGEGTMVAPVAKLANHEKVSVLTKTRKNASWSSLEKALPRRPSQDLAYRGSAAWISSYPLNPYGMPVVVAAGYPQLKKDEILQMSEEELLDENANIVEKREPDGGNTKNHPAPPPAPPPPPKKIGIDKASQYQLSSPSSIDIFRLHSSLDTTGEGADHNHNRQPRKGGGTRVGGAYLGSFDGLGKERSLVGSKLWKDVFGGGNPGKHVFIKDTPGNSATGGMGHPKMKSDKPPGRAKKKVLSDVKTRNAKRASRITGAGGETTTSPYHRNHWGVTEELEFGMEPPDIRSSIPKREPNSKSKVNATSSNKNLLTGQKTSENRLRTSKRLKVEMPEIVERKGWVKPWRSNTNLRKAEPEPTPLRGLGWDLVQLPPQPPPKAPDHKQREQRTPSRGRRTPSATSTKGGSILMVRKHSVEKLKKAAQIKGRVRLKAEEEKLPEVRPTLSLDDIVDEISDSVILALLRDKRKSYSKQQKSDVLKSALKGPIAEIYKSSERDDSERRKKTIRFQDLPSPSTSPTNR